MSSSANTQWEVLIRIVKYLKKAPNQGIVYQDHGHMQVGAFSDVDWAMSPTVRKSTTCYYVFLGGNWISWTRSSVEAEHRVMAQKIWELIWVTNFGDGIC